jgi:hypothetical protein
MEQMKAEMGKPGAGGAKGKKKAPEELSNVRTMVNLTPALYQQVKAEVRKREDAGDRKASISSVIRDAISKQIGK